MNSESPNIILIVCDTLRKDILGTYGGPAKTPNLNMLAKDSMVYENAIAPSPWTFPSHISMFTGMYGKDHGMHETEKIKSFGLMPENKRSTIPTITQYLKGYGYSTMGISNNIMISRFTSFDKNFDSFFNVEMDLLQSKDAKEAMALGASPMQIAMTLAKSYRFGKIARYFREFVKIQMVSMANGYPLKKGAELTNSMVFSAKLDPSFFLFLNFMEMHEPYMPGRGEEKTIIFDALTDIRPISKSKASDLKSRYIKSAEELDRNIGLLVETLKTRGIYDNTMIIITSDHGQAFDEHGYMYHGIYLYDEIIRVPLVIKYPQGKKFKKREGYQSLVMIPEMIKRTMEGKDDSALTTALAFSESYGNDKLLPKSYEQRQRIVDGKYEKRRKAVYKGGFKLTANGSDGTIEEFMKGSKSKSWEKNKSKVRELLGELRKFSKGEDFKFPKV